MVAHCWLLEAALNLMQWQIDGCPLLVISSGLKPDAMAN
jgi:hypothetical protein